MITHRLCSAMLVTVLSTIGIAQASEISESEPNNPIGSSVQRVDIPDGSVTISGVLGNVTGATVDDLDFYMFWGKEGDLVTVDIDGGWGGLRNVDTVIAIFGSGAGYPMYRMNDDASLDAGSTSTRDSRIENFRLPATGDYIVGVSNFPRSFSNGATVSNSTKIGNGDYQLIISGVSSPVQQINIDIKPGSDELAPINPKAKGKIPVALLSSGEFDAMTADTSSLTFGPTGNEKSFVRCGAAGEDVNGDGRMDMVCHFENQLAGFTPGDLEGIVRGKTLNGRMFEGRGLLKVVPEKRGF